MAWGALVGGISTVASSLIGKKARRDTAKKLAKKAVGAAVAIGGGGAAIGAASATVKAVSTAFGGGPDRAYPPKDLFGGIGGPSGFKAFGRVFGGGSGRLTPGDNGACPKGYHLNKTKLSDGLERGSVCVRNRRVNYANGRAASRAGRRLRGTVKMLRKSFSLVSGKAPRGKFIPRKRKG